MGCPALGENGTSSEPPPEPAPDAQPEPEPQPEPAAQAEPAPEPVAQPEPPEPSVAERAEPPARVSRRPVFAAAFVLALVAVLGLGAVGVFAAGSGSPPAGVWVAPSGTSAAPSAAAKAPVSPSPDDQVVSMSATGDIIMGAAPGGLPPDNGRTFFTGVRGALHSDLQMGNLEQPLTNDTGVSKCAPGSTNCFAFRSPPSYANLLRDAGFALMNLANNHAYDFGPDGNRQTRAALDSVGVKHTGAPGEITVVNVKGLRVAVLGFAPYAWAQSLTDIPAASALVKRAQAAADLVVVQMHVGAEGDDKTHIRPGEETYLGEDRGDSMKFAHAVVDAGADLVVGHGPHVVRALEFYRGRLIAYSLGNFAGYKALHTDGVLKLGAILKVSLHRDGSYAGGSLVGTRMVSPGLPSVDPKQETLALLRSLCAGDLPSTGAKIGPDGTLTPG
jgi:hypothetical protein